MKVTKNSILAFLSIVLLAACGGGGGGGASSPSVPSIPLPTVDFSSSASSVANGLTVTLTWSSSNATSCSASGSDYWTGSKGASGSEEVQIEYGENILSISCTGAGGTSSRQLTIDGTQAYDASAFVPLGQTKRYKGFIFNKYIETVGCLATVYMDITNEDGFLSIDYYGSDEWRNIQFDFSDGEYTSGLRLSNDYSAEEGDEPGTLYRTAITDSVLNGIEINENDVDPYTFELESVDDLEQFGGNIYLEAENSYYCTPSIEMGLIAFPNTASTANDGLFLGTSRNDEFYTFLYLVAEDYWESFSNNLPTESDIFQTNWIDMDIFTSFGSNPNITFDSVYGYRVSTELVETANNTYDWVLQTLIGSRYTDTITLSDNAIWFEDEYFTKYLYEGNDSWSSQRVFVKGDTSSDCWRAYNQFRDCRVSGLEILFFTPDKEGLVGFKLGGYISGSGYGPHETNVKLGLSND